MAGELIGGTVLGSVFSEGLSVLIEKTKNVLEFEPVSNELSSTMEDLHPILTTIESLQTPEEFKSLGVTISKAEDLVKRCTGVTKWEVFEKAKCTKEVREIQKEMVSFCQVKLQFLQLSNQLHIVKKLDNMMKGIDDTLNIMRYLHNMMKDIDDNLEFITKYIDLLREEMKINHEIVNENVCLLREEAKNNHEIVIEKLGSLVPALVYRYHCLVPKLGKEPVGFDWPLKELKTKLLDDSVRRLLVSGNGGCGKTTLVTQLCHDEEIKRKFTNIFFNVVSSTPNFRKLVQDLFEHNCYQAPTFHNDTQASAGLGILLEELKGNGILLVLDDAWFGADSLLEKFSIDIPDLKILVTSRYGFPGFDSTYPLKPLEPNYARTALIGYASQPDHASEAEYEELLQKILKQCHGFPLVIKVLGGSLKNRTLAQWKGQVISWSTGGTVLDTSDVLNCLKPSFDALDARLQHCFLDLGLFLEDQKIRASVIIDIWVELHGNIGKTEKEKSIMCMLYLQELANHNLLDLVPLGRKEPEDGFYNDFLVMQHDILRELAIRQSESEAILKRKRVNLEIIDNNFPEWCWDPEGPRINASLLSIYTDDKFSSNWVKMECPNVEALVLNISSSEYTLPKFISTMKRLKVVIIINHGYEPTRLCDFSCLSSLPNLKRIRLEKVLITFSDILLLQGSYLKKFSFVMCKLGKVSHDTKEIVDASKALPSLQEIDIDYCYDLVELPLWVFDLVSLKILSITNCNKLSILPEAIGNLSKLETLRLSSCRNLSELPEATAELNNLRFLDISECLEMKKLPREIGRLENLKKISMRKCSRCELPDSVRNLEDLEVTCDEETKTILWERLKPKMRNLSVYEEETEHNLNWLYMF